RIEPHPVRIDERRLRRENVDAVAHQLVPRDVDLVADHVIDPEQQIAHRDVLLDRVGGAVETALAVSRQPQRRLAQRLARDRSGVDADTADDGALLDDRHAFIELRRLDRGAMTGRTRTDDEQVVIVVRHEGSSVHRGSSTDGVRWLARGTTLIEPLFSRIAARTSSGQLQPAWRSAADSSWWVSLARRITSS